MPGQAGGGDTSRRQSGVAVTVELGGEAGGGNLGAQPWLQSIMDEIHERREECDKLARELEIQRQHFKQELEYLGGQLREEAIREHRHDTLRVSTTVILN